jgi:hypothetical protein
MGTENFLRRTFGAGNRFFQEIFPPPRIAQPFKAGTAAPPRAQSRRDERNAAPPKGKNSAVPAGTRPAPEIKPSPKGLGYYQGPRGRRQGAMSPPRCARSGKAFRNAFPPRNETERRRPRRLRAREFRKPARTPALPPPKPTPRGPPRALRFSAGPQSAPSPAKDFHPGALRTARPASRARAKSCALTRDGMAVKELGWPQQCPVPTDDCSSP